MRGNKILQLSLWIAAALLALLVVFSVVRPEEAAEQEIAYAEVESSSRAQNPEVAERFAVGSEQESEADESVKIRRKKRKVKQTETTEEKTEAVTETEETTEEIEEAEIVEANLPDAELGSRLTIIGDSISWLTADTLRAALPGVDIYAMGGKTMQQAMPNNPSGLETIRAVEEAGELRDLVVFELGTNDRPDVGLSALTADMFEELHQITGNRTVFLVTNYSYPMLNSLNINNEVIIAAANSYEDWYVIDWADYLGSRENPAAYLDPNDEIGWAFRVHPVYPEGYDFFVNYLVYQIQETL